MFTKLPRLPVLMAFGLPLNTLDNSLDVPNKKFVKLDENETSLSRIKKIFQTDEYGRMSHELNSIYQATFMGLFTGAVYGGILGSRKSYADFMERNQATAFESNFDAQRKLQDQVTIGFGKNAFRFGWRLALFTGTYTALTTIISVYRGKSSIIEYAVAGACTGSIYKFNLGLRGIAAGSLVGGSLGTIAGLVSLMLLKATGTTMEEVQFYQYKWRENRDNNIREGLKKEVEGTEHDDELIKLHDRRADVGSNLDIKMLESDESKQQ